MKKDLEILEIDDANEDGTPRTTSAGKRYTKFKTSDGWMSCFDELVCANVKALIHKVASLEVVEKGKYKNITKCYGEAKFGVGLNEPVEVEDHTIKKEVKPFEKDPVGLAVDVFCAIYEKNANSDKEICMKTCIELVKQAQEAF